MISAADVEAELLKPDRGKRTGAQNITLLLLSVAAFAATGLLRTSWTYTVIIVVVLFVHESGHWLAMKFFGYSDLQMFFIPFFGAAVSGKDSNTTGARKAIVALLGPAPGIVLGLISGFVYMKWHEPLFLRYAVTSLFINGLNLLPIYPLDGGRFMEIVIFSRHPAVEIVFKVLAVLALVGLAVRLSSISLGILAFATLFLTREAYYQNKIVGRLKVISGGQPVPKAEHFPVEYLEAILPDLSDGLSRNNVKPKLLANRAESVWRRFSQQPPRFGPSLALLGAYAGIFLLAIGGVFGAAWLNRASNEKAVISHRAVAGGKSVLVEERYWKQSKISEVQLNGEGLYEGPSTYWTTAGTKREEGSWVGGYWQGEWKNYDTSGKIISIVTYDNGRPTRYQTPSNGAFVDVKPDQWPAATKLSMQRSPARTSLKLPEN
jgi:Zn-dependent protease